MYSARVPVVRSQWLQLLLAFYFIAFGILLPNGNGNQILEWSRHTNSFIVPYTFPHGGRDLFPNYRLVAIYGSPGEPGLGALGQQALPDTIAKVKNLAQQYQPLIKEYALPTLEIIATIASGSPTDQGTYSRLVNPDVLMSWVQTARQNGVYVVLDLQPGRSDFLSQAKHYEGILKQPNVGLALDPEWRLTAAEVPLQQIGTVDISEINQTDQWLASLTGQNRLPQKLFLLHEFRLSMITNRGQLDTAHPELAYVIQMDGEGSQSEKIATWGAVISDPPSGVNFGWKNFYTRDSPLRSPQDTMQLAPTPWYVSYQ